MADEVVIDPLAGTGIPSVAERPRPRARKRRGDSTNLNSPSGTGIIADLAQPVCPAGHPVAASQKFCSECGQELKMAGPPQCRNGHVVDAAAHFCPQCGVEIGQEIVFQATGDHRPRPDNELSQQELAERERQHQRAVSFGKKNPVISYAPGHAPPNVGSVVIHFVADGFTAFGNVWVRGQEIEVWPGHPRWNEAQQWINFDTRMQYARWKKEYFRPGPWPGERSYLAGISGFQQLKAVGGEGSVGAPTEEELRRGDEGQSAAVAGGCLLRCGCYRFNKTWQMIRGSFLWVLSRLRGT